MTTASAAIHSAGANMLSALIKQVEQMPKPWQQMPEREQQVVIFRLREAVEASVKQLVKTIAGGNHVSIPASVESLTFKDGVKVALKLAKGTDSLHSLVDAQGSVVQIVLASVDQYIDGIDQIRASADQAELFEPHDTDDETIETPQAELGGFEGGGKADPESGVPQFVFGLLASVGVHVELETVQNWTKEELTVAAGWAGEYAKDPESCTVARPHWLPIPEPKAADASGESYSRTGEPNDQEFGSVDIPLENLAGEHAELVTIDEGGETITLESDEDDDLDLDDVEDEELDDERHEDAA
jgi:hypothetical protein